MTKATYRVCHEIEVRERCSKVCTIDIGLPRAFRKKQTMATGTKDINGVVSRQIGQAHWQYGLTLTKDTWTAPKVGIAIFFIHGVHSSVGDNVTLIPSTTITILDWPKC
jgi:hypothetical protein